MLFARRGLDREAAPSHSGAMVCDVDTGGGRRYEIGAEVSLAVGDVIVEVNGKDAGMEGELGPLLPPNKATV